MVLKGALVGLLFFLPVLLGGVGMLGWLGLVAMLLWWPEEEQNDNAPWED